MVGVPATGAMDLSLKRVCTGGCMFIIIQMQVFPCHGFVSNQVKLNASVWLNYHLFHLSLKGGCVKTLHAEDTGADPFQQGLAVIPAGAGCTSLLFAPTNPVVENMSIHLAFLPCKTVSTASTDDFTREGIGWI